MYAKTERFETKGRDTLKVTVKTPVVLNSCKASRHNNETAKLTPILFSLPIILLKTYITNLHPPPHHH